MDESGAQLLRKYLQVLKRRWWVIVLIVGVAAVSAGAVSLRMTPMYQAKTEINVAPFISPNSSNSNILNLLTDPTLALQTDVNLIQNDAVLTIAANSLGLASDAGLKESISASVLTGTLIIQVQATSANPRTAAAWANAAANAFLSYQRNTAVNQVTASGKDLNANIDSLKAQIAADGTSPASATAVSSLNDDLATLQGQLDQLPGINSIVGGGGSVVQQAAIPTLPISPKKKQNVALGAMVGLLLGVGVVLLIEALDDRLRTAEEVEEAIGVPILGSVPYAKELSQPADSAALVHQPASPVAEAYRTLRTNLRFLSVDRPLRTLLVTSSVSGEGKSTTAANLAAAFAVSGVRTILISADLRRPSVHRFFGMQNSVGVVDAVLPDAALERLLQANELADLRVLAAGKVPPNPAEILASNRFGEILEILKSAADLVIVDSPPLLGVADASALASRIDGVLLVVNPLQVDRRTLGHAKAQLKKAGGSLLGSVVNAVGPSMGYGYGYSYDYYAPDGQEPRKARKRRTEDDEPRRGRRRLPGPSVSAGAAQPDPRRGAGTPLGSDRAGGTAAVKEAMWRSNQRDQSENGYHPAIDGATTNGNGSRPGRARPQPPTNPSADRPGREPDPRT